VWVWIWVCVHVLRWRAKSWLEWVKEFIRVEVETSWLDSIFKRTSRFNIEFLGKLRKFTKSLFLVCKSNLRNSNQNNSKSGKWYYGCVNNNVTRHLWGLEWPNITSVKKKVSWKVNLESFLWNINNFAE
jgi:hypothetical protein